MLAPTANLWYALCYGSILNPPLLYIVIAYCRQAMLAPITKSKISFHVFSSLRQRRLLIENHTIFYMGGKMTENLNLFLYIIRKKILCFKNFALFNTKNIIFSRKINTMLILGISEPRMASIFRLLNIMFLK